MYEEDEREPQPESHTRARIGPIPPRPPRREPDQRRANARDEIEEADKKIETETAQHRDQRPSAPRWTGRTHQEIRAGGNDADQQAGHRAEGGLRSQYVYERHPDEVEHDVGRRNQTHAHE